MHKWGIVGSAYGGADRQTDKQTERGKIRIASQCFIALNYVWA